MFVAWTANTLRRRAREKGWGRKRRQREKVRSSPFLRSFNIKSKVGEKFPVLDCTADCTFLIPYVRIFKERFRVIYIFLWLSRYREPDIKPNNGAMGVGARANRNRNITNRPDNFIKQ